VCRNPALAAERARKREALLAATEEALGTVAAMVGRGRRRTAAAIGLRAGRVVNAKKMAMHFELDIAEGVFAYCRRADQIAAEAALDGLYVVRTSVSAERLGTSAVVETYKRLAVVERAPGPQERRARRPPDLPLAPRPGPGAPVPVLPRLLRALAPRSRLGAAPLPGRSSSGSHRSGRTAGALTLGHRQGARAPHARRLPGPQLPDAARRARHPTRNRVVPAGADERAAFELLSEPTPLQARALELIGVSQAGT
jgi:hypothetical protein